MKGLMSEILSTKIMLYRKLRGYHWNIKGSEFFVLHGELEKMYIELVELIDEFAEKMVYKEFYAHSSMNSVVEHSQIEDFEFKDDYKKMMTEIVNDYQTLVDLLGKLNDVADENNEKGIEDMTGGMINGLEQRIWMLRSYLK